MARLFGTDGVRGIANEELTPLLAMQLGQAGAYVLTKEKAHKPTIMVGCDTRISGDMLANALMAGACSVGANCVYVGVLPTPAVAYLTQKYKVDAGVVRAVVVLIPAVLGHGGQELLVGPRDIVGIPVAEQLCAAVHRRAPFLASSIAQRRSPGKAAFGGPAPAVPLANFTIPPPGKREKFYLLSLGKPCIIGLLH